MLWCRSNATVSSLLAFLFFVCVRSDTISSSFISIAKNVQLHVDRCEDLLFSIVFLGATRPESILQRKKHVYFVACNVELLSCQEPPREERE